MDKSLIHEVAKRIAYEANKCCCRSDGYEEDIYAFAEKEISDLLSNKHSSDLVCISCDKTGTRENMTQLARIWWHNECLHPTKTINKHSEVTKDMLPKGTEEFC